MLAADWLHQQAAAFRAILKLCDTFFLVMTSLPTLGPFFFFQLYEPPERYHLYSYVNVAFLAKRT